MTWLEEAQALLDDLVNDVNEEGRESYEDWYGRVLIHQMRSPIKEVPFWDTSNPTRPGRSYTTVNMKDLDGRVVDEDLPLRDQQFRPDPDWMYEPEPRDGTFYSIKEGALGRVNQVFIAGLRMYSSWKKPAPRCSLCGEVWCDCKPGAFNSDSDYP